MEKRSGVKESGTGGPWRTGTKPPDAGDLLRLQGFWFSWTEGFGLGEQDFGNGRRKEQWPSDQDLTQWEPKPVLARARRRENYIETVGGTTN